MYYDDYGEYPALPGPGGTKGLAVSSVEPGNEHCCYWSSNWLTLETMLEPYINLPRDPINLPYGGISYFLIYRFPDVYAYFYSNSDEGDTQTYDLITRLETDHNFRCENQQHIVHSYIIDEGLDQTSVGDIWCDPGSGYGPQATHIYSDH